MTRVFAVIITSLILSGCTIDRLPDAKPGELIVVCPDGQVTINTGTANCFDFMKLENP